MVVLSQALILFARMSSLVGENFILSVLDVKGKVKIFSLFFQAKSILENKDNIFGWFTPARCGVEGLCAGGNVGTAGNERRRGRGLADRPGEGLDQRSMRSLFPGCVAAVRMR